MQEEIGVITDYVNPMWVLVSPCVGSSLMQIPRLTEINKNLIDAYLDIPYVETKCGYACSDQ